MDEPTIPDMFIMAFALGRLMRSLRERGLIDDADVQDMCETVLQRFGSTQAAEARAAMFLNAVRHELKN